MQAFVFVHTFHAKQMHCRRSFLWNLLHFHFCHNPLNFHLFFLYSSKFDVGLLIIAVNWKFLLLYKGSTYTSFRWKSHCLAWARQTVHAFAIKRFANQNAGQCSTTSLILPFPNDSLDKFSRQLRCPFHYWKKQSITGCRLTDASAPMLGVSWTVDICLERDMVCITTQVLILHREMAARIQRAIWSRMSCQSSQIWAPWPSSPTVQEWFNCHPSATFWSLHSPALMRQ